MKSLKLAVLCLPAFFYLSCSLSPFGEKMKFTGTLEMTEHKVGARAAGRIRQLNVDEGSRVRRGDLLAVLDRYDQNAKDLKRAEALFKAGGVSEQSLELARLSLEDQSIVSPVDGIVLLKVHEAGEIAAAGSPVVVVGDDSKFWVRIYVPEGQINKIRLGQGALIRFDGIRKRYPGHVSYVAPQAEFTPRNVQTPEERVTQTFAVKVNLDDAEEFVRPGVAAEVTLKNGKVSP
ncbi:MAG: HlyD family efflux transporter periplasmic adaptor subunit [Candidatus Omnitrophica bacterium]|nr:HlyD family efflux transporter periplasmic adaptor subunit [Candidatus Omnitrophota bacterium]